jgi:putative ABC transport system permease protein
MIRFLWKGLLRDRSRSLIPMIVIAMGTFLTVLMYNWMSGVIGDMTWANAAFQTGHAKVTTVAFANEADQLPNDLAITDVQNHVKKLSTENPELNWTPRIRFGGLLDIPDKNNETKSQAPVMGMAVNLFDPQSPERQILNLEKALISGRLPQNPGEILVSDELAKKLKIENGSVGTLISSTMYGSMTMYNFNIVGTIKYGIIALDRGAVLADILDVQIALDMNDAAGEILGFYPDQLYRTEALATIASQYNTENVDENDEFSLTMKTLRDQNGLDEMLDLYDGMLGIFVFIFVTIMSIVLWNTGLMGSLRRYGEIGIRLAMGEAKGHVYRSLILESVSLGFAGAVIGATVGLLVSWYLQVHGVDVSAMMKSSSMLMSSVMRSKVSTTSVVMGFIPGFIAPILGTSLSGIGIYRRQTSQLFKELEV